MDIRKFIKPNQLVVGEDFTSKSDLMERLLDALISGLPETRRKKGFGDLCRKKILEREERDSTAMGEGMFLPHARLPRFETLGISIAVLKNPLDLGAPDGVPVSFACMMIVSEDDPGLALKVYRALAESLINPEIRTTFEQAPDAQALYELIQHRDLTLELSLTAADIMKPPFFKVFLDDPLPRITHNMARFREPATAVTDDKGTMLGEISSDDLFQFGMPEFFKQLKSVSFVRNFNPLENYFTVEAEKTAADLMNQDYAWVPPTGTLIEIIFQLSVKKHTKVYVLDNGKLVGVIGRMNVIDRAVNF